MLKRILIAIALLFGLAACGVGALALNANRFIYHPSTAIVAPSLDGVSVEHIRTSDGQTLVAWYSPPPHGGPIFLFFDGNGGRPQIWNGRWRRIQEGGAGFLAVSYRGYSGSTGSPSEAGLHEDARAGYDWLTAHGYSPQDIVIHGFSLGTGVAVRLAAERPARALILEAPFTSINDVASEHAPMFASSSSVITDSFASRDWIGRVHMPVLIIHGDHDSVVPFDEGEHLFALANDPKQFVRMPGSDHATLVRDGDYDYIWRFLATHPAGAADGQSRQ
ncbi:MAG: prolyl oligopeptidase family serine peptidase [Vitreimonas sp.]